MNYLNYFFNPQHLFNLRPQAMEPRAIIILAICFALVIIAGILAQIMSKKIKDGLKVKAYRRIYHAGLVMGIIGFGYLFFAWQGVTLLSARFIILIWLAALIIWLIYIIKYLIKDVPKTRSEIEEKRKFEKYIP